MEVLDFMLASTVRLASASTLATDDDRGGPTNRTLAAGWYRTFLAPSGGTGTETDPAELLLAVETALDPTRWTVRLAPSGLVRITYLGSGTGSLAIGTADLANLLGHTGGTITLASGAYHDGEYLPTHCVFAIACDPDTGWVDTPGRFAGSEFPDGTVYGWHDGLAQMKRSLTFRLLPRDQAVRAALLTAGSGSTGTPAFGPTSRRRSPIVGEPGQAPPWGAMETLATAAARQCGAAIGTLQSLIAGTSTAFDVCYLAPECFTQGGRLRLSIERHDARRDLALDLVWTSEGAL
jgi:hypothetical protein